MNNLFSLFLLLLLVSAAPAQQSIAGSVPALKILKQRWYLAIPESGGSPDFSKALRDQADARQELQDMNNEYPVASSRLMDPKFPITPLKDYRYEIKVKNTGSKVIRKVGWTYVFKDSNTNAPTGIINLVSPAAIKPGKTKQLTGRSATRPMNMTITDRQGKRRKAKLRGEARIDYIEYADGSGWRR